MNAGISSGSQPVTLQLPQVSLQGDLVLPEAARGLIVFAHGSGSSRLSLRNRAVAGSLQARGFGTLLFDLLTEAEDEYAGNRFDIGLLAGRLHDAVSWLRRQHGWPSALPLGYFGASTGAAAALMAAAEPGVSVFAVVSRGGRPDLAGPALPRVAAPTLLIVGGEDREVLELNRRALSRLRAVHELAIVPGASHLFEEPGALEAVAVLAGDWFERHHGAPRSA